MKLDYLNIGLILSVVGGVITIAAALLISKGQQRQSSNYKEEIITEAKTIIAEIQTQKLLDTLSNF